MHEIVIENVPVLMCAYTILLSSKARTVSPPPQRAIVLQQREHGSTLHYL